MIAACNANLGAFDDSDSVSPDGAGAGVGGPGSGGTNGTPAGGGPSGSGSSQGAGGDATIPPAEVGGIKIEGSPRHYRVVRLTHEQWEKSVRDLLKLPSAPGLASTFFPDPKGGALFSNNEEGLYVTDTLATDYERAAQTVADNVTKDSGALSRLGNANNADAFIQELGTKAHKRPLTTEEVAEYRALWDLAPELLPDMSPFAGGARIFIEALLQSPHFLNRLVLADDGARLSGPELAARISYFLFDTLPSDELLAAAQTGALDTNAGLAAKVEELLGSDEAMASIRRFFDEYYGIEREAGVTKDTTAFPTFTEATAVALRDADIRFFDFIYNSDGGVRDIFLSTVGFANQQIASIYGVSVNGNQLQQVDLGPNRPGFLTRAGFLAVNGTLKQPDPIHRGVDINRKMLCAILDPPAGVIPPLPAPKEGQTNREAVTELTGVGVCGECHNGIINPPGFALEAFDAVGKVRTMDNGKPIDTTGTFAAIPGNPAFQGAEDMAKIIADSETAHACFSARLAEYALTRDVSGNDKGLVEDLMKQSHASDASIKELILALVQSPAFTNAKTGN